MVCWPRLQHRHAPCTVRAIHAAVGVVIVYPAFCRVMAPVKRCGLLIVFDLFELFLTRILITGYYYYYYYYYVCVVKHLIPLAGVCIIHAPAASARVARWWGSH